MFYNILVTLDGSELAETVIPYVEGLATRFPTRKVVLLRVVPPPHYFFEGSFYALGETQEQMEAIAQEYLDKIASRLQAKGLPVEIELRRGEVASEIIDYAHEHGIDLLAMSTHGRSGVKRWVFGSVAEKVLRSLNLPILLIRPEEVQI
ncbi:MAG: universal stress protein [Nitrospinae bacterium]|nr:universal stress protein [Nitrospinota bacterium]